jgi:cytochrome b
MRAETATGGADATPRGWDPLLRLTHWAIAVAVLLNALIVDDDSLAHVWIGYAAFGVLGLRLLWGLIGPESARFSAFPPAPRAAVVHLGEMLRGEGKGLRRSHNPLGALMAYALWGVLLLVSVSGAMLESDAFWGVEWVEDLHEAAANGLLALAALHVAGVMLESRRLGLNLTRAMIDGERGGR